MTTTYDALLPEVLPYVPNCPEMSAVNAIRNAVIEFCTGSWYWQHDCYPIPAIAGLNEFEPDLPTQTKFVGVVDAFFGGRPLKPNDEATLRNRYANRDFRAWQGTPAYWYQTDPDKLLLVPTPDTEAAKFSLDLRIAVAPTRVSTGADDALFERYAETIAAGAIARLKAVPGQPYSDQAGAQVALILFKKAIVEARSLIERNMTRGPLRVRFNGRTP
jgi:hypothetical protein